MKIHDLDSTTRQDIDFLQDILFEAIARFYAIEEEQEQIEVEPDEDSYEEVLNDLYGVIDICGYSYNAGYVLKTLDPIAFSCGANDYANFIDIKETEAYKELTEELESVTDYIEEIQEAIAETPFGLAAEYDESPADFFTTHLISTNTLNPADLIPAMMDILKNTVEYQQMTTGSGFFAGNLEKALEERESTDDIDLQEVCQELIELCEQYAPTGFTFGCSEGNGSDIGYHFDGFAYMIRKGGYIHIHYTSEEIQNLPTGSGFGDEQEASFYLYNINNEPRFVAVNHVSKKTASGCWIIYDKEQDFMLDIIHRYGTKEQFLENLRSGITEPKRQRFQYRYDIDANDKTIITHQVFDILKQETVYGQFTDRQTVLDYVDKLNNKAV